MLTFRSIFILIFLIGTTYSKCFAQNTTYFFLVGIDNYNKEKYGADKIKGYSDVKVIEKLILKEFNSRKEIILPAEEDMTAEKVRKGLDKLIKRKLTAGDNLVMYWATHGQRISDIDSSDDEPDGFDESLVLINTPVSENYTIASMDYDRSKHILDDELWSYVQSARAKVGVNGKVILLVDACYSGGISKSGTKMLDDFRLRGHKKSDKIEKNLFSEYTNVNDSGGLSPYVFLASSSSYDRISEFKSNRFRGGMLLAALKEAVLGKTPDFFTYNDVYLRITEFYSKYVHTFPVIGGTGLYLPIGAGTNYPGFLFQKGNRKWKIIESPSGNIITQLIPRSTLPFFKDGAKLFILREDSIVSESTLMVDDGNYYTILPEYLSNQIRDDHNLWRAIPQIDHSIRQVLISCSDNEISSKLNEFSKWLLVVNKSNEEVDFNLKRDEKGKFHLSSTRKTFYFKSQEELLDFLKVVSIGKNLRNLDIGSSYGSVRTDDLHIEIGSETSSGFVENQSGLFKAGRDKIDFRITNKTEKVKYFALIQITPDDIPYILLPGRNENPIDYSLDAGESYTIKSREVVSNISLGQQVLKFIVSNNSFDLEQELLQHTNYLSNSHPLNILINGRNKTHVNQGIIINKIITIEK